MVKVVDFLQSYFTMGKDNERADNGPCQKYACEIQTCLQKNGYDANRCKYEIERFKKCKADYDKRKKDEQKEPPR